jgi:SAM-dependent methyltransferase
MKGARGRFQGVLQILRFNWPMYAGTFFAFTLVGVGTMVVPLSHPLRVVVLLAIFSAGFWLVGSLVISHYIYDRSPLYHGAWIRPALHETPARYGNLHAGFDEFSGTLRRLFPESEATVIDFFDANEMTEPSIERARRESENQSAIRANYRSLPLPDGELDAAFLIFAAHELRRSESRAKLFAELRRVVKPGGQILLVEHLRDGTNFLAFGPGFFHFHSRAEWLRIIAAADLTVAHEFRLTPFVRAFVLQRAVPNV